MKKILISVSLLALSACSVIPPQAYYNRGDPENLLDVSSEVVNLSLNSSESLDELADTIVQDPPARAELHCPANSKLCAEAKTLFDRHNIASQSTAGNGGVTLIYQRVMARDCENRFIDNTINPYNLPPPTFGCSLTGNMVQMVSDKRQFVNPNLLDFHDGNKAVQDYEAYAKPSPASEGNAPPPIWMINTVGSGSH